MFYLTISSINLWFQRIIATRKLELKSSNLTRALTSGQLLQPFLYIHTNVFWRSTPEFTSYLFRLQIPLSHIEPFAQHVEKPQHVESGGQQVEIPQHFAPTGQHVLYPQHSELEGQQVINSQHFVGSKQYDRPSEENKGNDILPCELGERMGVEEK